jgi:signal transduction histidine kinase
LLDFARLERSQLRLQPEVVTLADLHQTVVELALLEATESGNIFQHHCDTALIPIAVNADARRIEQVIMILLTNAFRYTQSGAVWLHTECLALDDERVQVRFSVRDTGRGISPDALGRIFEAFERGDTVDGDGMGLGLCIAQPLLALMHSHLEVKSQIGVGSTFAFALELPRTQQTNPTHSAHPTSDSHAPPNMVLHADDWAQLAHIAQSGDLTALEVWQQRFPELPPDLQRLVWVLDFEGIARFAAAQQPATQT